MSGAHEALSDIPGRRRKLESYSGLYNSRAHVFEPRSVDDLRRILAHALAGRHRVTLRSGGHSFDAQSLGDDVVVWMRHFDEIGEVETVPDAKGEYKRVRVGAGATWGAIVAKLQPLGLVPAVTVTTQHATAGGTLAGDCLSRFSPAWGKEGRWVESFEMLTMDGHTLTCLPPSESKREGKWSQQERAFMATIGGLGYVGVVLAITYRLLDVGPVDERIGVRTEVRKDTSFDGLASALVPAVAKTHGEDSDVRDPRKHDAIYSAVSGRLGDPQTLLFTSAFTTTKDRHPMLLFRPHLLLRIFVEWGFRWEAFNKLLWWASFRFGFAPGMVYLDDLEGYTFFMDGNVRAKAAARLFGVRLKTLQQTFVVPSETKSQAGWDQAKDDLVEWLEHAEVVLRERGLTPTLQDVLFLPRDERFPMSMTAGMAGFAVTYAFETSNKRRLARAQEAFVVMADMLWDKFRGRVYLVKNVHASKKTLTEMYGANVAEFFAIKSELDPHGLLRNEFLERTFGDHVVTAA
jgi:decaprenylphospho-beta-D-ribofuranose 2-oxidase